MNKKIMGILHILMLIVICAILIDMPIFATQSELNDIRDSIQQLEDEQKKKEEELDELEADKAYLDGRLAELNHEISGLAEKLIEYERKLEQKEAEIQENSLKLEEARQKEEQQYEDMKKRIRFLYERGETNLLEIFLEARSFTDFLNISEYVESIHAYDRRMLEEYQSLKEEIAAREEQLELEQQELEELVLQQQEAMENVEQLVAEVKTDLSNTSSQIADAESQMAANDARIQQQKAYEEELEAKKAEEDAKRLAEIKKQEQENQGPPVTSNSPDDVAMLAALIECEAGGESYDGKLAVGSVVVNRIRSSYFPNTLVGVIYQSGQFSPVASGRFAIVLNRGADSGCLQAAQEVLGGRVTINSLYFRRNNGLISGTVIGNHVFY